MNLKVKDDRQQSVSNEERLQDELANVEKLGKSFRGRRELIKHLNGKTLTPRQAGLACCYQCMGYYDNGAEDCEVPECGLYSIMPYGKGKKKREISPAHRERLVQARKLKIDSSGSIKQEG